MSVSPAPVEQVVLLGVESYDCGWVYDTGIIKDGRSSIPYVEGLQFNHMSYTHWFENPGKLAWKHISSAPKDKVILLGDKAINGQLTAFCSAWWCSDLGCWVSTGGIGKLLPIQRKFNFFAIPPDHTLAK